MARFKIGTKVYTTAALDEVSLRDLVLFNTQAADMGLAEKWSDVERIAGEFDAMTEAEAEGHPDKLLMIGVTVWASRRGAGEDLSFGDALDFPLSQLDFLPEPEDRKPGKPKGSKGPKKATQRSEVAESPAEPSEAAETPTTSESPSTAASSS